MLFNRVSLPPVDTDDFTEDDILVDKLIVRAYELDEMQNRSPRAVRPMRPWNAPEHAPSKREYAALERYVRGAVFAHLVGLDAMDKSVPDDEPLYARFGALLTLRPGWHPAPSGALGTNPGTLCFQYKDQIDAIELNATTTLRGFLVETLFYELRDIFGDQEPEFLMHLMIKVGWILRTMTQQSETSSQCEGTVDTPDEAGLNWAKPK